ncbi:CUB domain protein [Teladorsagia circumcincta]|uniref:CUB domain protein n=1 Tax=Teladorsagia circumcincta TaxID=45464 RepID=A0A2G9UHR3_TELCI|nr:CUB domain protein [Teladorsagia circumcincta]
MISIQRFRRGNIFRCNDGDFGGRNIRSGTINSPGYPTQYYNNLDCYYQIEGPVDTYITITFTTVMMESFYDYIEIFDGENTTKVIGEIDTWMPIKNTFESTTNHMLVYFHTDAITTDVGWSAQWNVKSVPYLSFSHLMRAIIHGYC